jgi:UTP--glucose-1-phosphate uridylyltransferase
VHIDETHLYGIVSCSEYNHLLQPIGVSIPITAIIEKPISQAIPSTLAVAGRYIFTPEIFAPLENLEKGKGGEIQLTDAIQKLLSNNIVYAYHYQANRYDCGSKLGYLQATVDLAKQQPVLGKQFIDWLKVN